MTTAFEKMKSLRGKRSLEKLTEQIEKQQNKGYSKNDERVWKLERDKAGNGTALIRFLPLSPQDIEIDPNHPPYVRMYSHAFQGPTGQWYIENSLTTKNQNDPVSELNTELWNSGQKAQARAQKRKLRYTANILVLKDPANPENEGKVFLYEFGKKIFDKIKDAMFPESDALREIEPVNPFCPWTGADFELRVRQVDGYANYDKSTFSEPTELFDGDETKIEEVYNSEYSLLEIVSDDKFKTYDELKTKLQTVLGSSTGQKKTEVEITASTNTQEASGEEDVDADDFSDLDDDITSDVGDIDSLISELDGEV